MGSKEEGTWESTSGSKGFETTGRTAEPKPTDALFEKSKVPEVPMSPIRNKSTDRKRKTHYTVIVVLAQIGESLQYPQATWG